jgi:hypothetical protein
MRVLLSCLLLWPLAASPQVKLTQAPDRIEVEIDGQPFTTLYMGPATTKPYLHPLRSASGKAVTRYYPMEEREGERRDHPHQRGLWFTHGDVNGYDFWANEVSQKGPNKGKVVLNKVLAVRSGSKQGVLEVSFDWLDPAGKPILNERRTMVFHSDPRLRMVDFDLRLTALQQVKFGDTKEGTFALRLAASLEEPARGAPPTPARTGKMVNAEGLEGERQVWGKRSAWVDYFGEVEGEKLGVAIFDHPGNPKHPTYWHARGYGLFAANVFGEHDFLADKTRDGSITLPAKGALRFRYRVVIHPGDYQSAGIAELYKRYAASR